MGAARATREGSVAVRGGKIWYRMHEGGDATPLVLVHGGPGFPSYYLDRLRALSDDRPVVFYDQLGVGRSDKPDDLSLWRIERFVEELATLRRALDLTELHLLGHSWGTQVVVDYLLTGVRGVSSVILSSPPLSIPAWVKDANELRKTLPADFQQAMARHEAAGTTDSEEYQAATLAYYQRFLCRLEPWPAEVQRSFEGFNPAVYGAMWGASEFFVNGNLAHYDRTPRLGELGMPVLFTAGRHDEATPQTVTHYHELTPGSALTIFDDSAHLAMVEETDRYLRIVRAFLGRVERGERPSGVFDPDGSAG